MPLRVPSALLLLLALWSVVASGREPVIGGPCEGCEYVFDGMPAKLESQAHIAAPTEPGEPLIIEGSVTDRNGAPAAGIVVYAYHTAAIGIYPSGPNAHGRLRAWVVTDRAGHYRFDTIRPGAYPGRRIPQHVHMHVVEPGVGTYYIDDVHFDDDPLLTTSLRQQEHSRGGGGVAHPRKDEHGIWQVRRDITLGMNIPG